ncbi:HNH endonuclease signature motif containing protein [Microbacterium karelineae]|uniref:HNH endonuclease signature motif containing protein n=2 Tax=Microbacterium karelineae TaxID=2654283 RepID=UPI0012EA4369|nr:HNH endonuclease signature motif containing protein [Microbacterium karelineae]
MDEERHETRLERLGLTPAEQARVRGLVEQVVERDRTIARAEGEKAELLAQLAEIADAEGRRSVASDGPEYARRAMAAEVAAATRVHPSAAKNRIEQAERLTSDYPVTHEALKSGRISKRHADVIAATGAGLDPGARASLDALAVPFAETRTPRELEKITQKQAAVLAPTSLRERHQAAREERRVVVTDREDGMSELWAYLPTFEARAIYDRATEMAKIIKTDRRRARRAFDRDHGFAPEDGWAAPVTGTLDGTDPVAVAASDRRTMDQLRADLIADVLLSAEPTGHELHASGTGATLTGIAATVQVTIPVTQILDPDEGTAWADDGGLVSPDTARIVAGSAAGWERLFVRPETGEIVAVDRYRPSEAQRRALIGRDMTCRFPGCTTPARKADLDHSREYARGGPTTIENLAALCEPHHMMKHHSGWRLRQVGGGVIEWTSPAGMVYTDEPVSRVFFQETPEAAEDEAREERREAEEARCEERARERREIERASIARALDRIEAEHEAREHAFAQALANGEVDIPDWGEDVLG